MRSIPEVQYLRVAGAPGGGKWITGSVITNLSDHGGISHNRDTLRVNLSN